MPIDVAVMKGFLDKVEALGIAPAARTSRAVRLKEREPGRTSWFPEDRVPWMDWAEGISGRREDILAFPETIGFVNHVHEVTGAETPYIRGTNSDVAEAFLLNAASMERPILLRSLVRPR